MSGESRRLLSLNARVANAASISRQPSQRVRRRLAFQRLLARMADSGWVLKGGYCLEARLAGQARATQDIDFVRRGAWPSEDALLEELDAVFATARWDDGFSFEALSARQMRSVDDPAPAWRVKVASRVDGTLFEPLTLDVVTQFDEVADAVERLVIPPPVTAVGLDDVVVAAVDVHQHAAEKFHAIGRLYVGDRPSSRVKDLVDLALLSEAGLLTDQARLAERLVVVHRLRDDASPPAELPSPPSEWVDGYARMVADLSLTFTTVDAAFEHVHALYRSVMSKGPLS